MKLIHASDLHLGYQQFGLEERFDDFTRAFTRIVDRTIETHADALIIVGDLFNKRDPNAHTLDVAISLLERLHQRGTPVIAVEGNHDKAFRSDGMSWMQLLNRREWITLLRPEFTDGMVSLPEWNPETRSGARITIGDTEFCGFGYLGALASRTLRQAAEQLPEHPKRVIMLHAGVAGTGPDIGRIRGEDIALLREKTTYLALGHVHRRYERDGWMFNPGAPEHWDVGEAAYEKGHYLVDLNDGVHAIHEPSEPRPAVIAKVDVAGSSDPSVARAKILAETGELCPVPRALLRLVVTGDADFRAADLDVSTIVADITERDGWLYVEPDNRVNETPLSAPGDMSRNSREDIEQNVLSQLVERNENLTAFGERGIEALLELKDLCRSDDTGEHMAQVAMQLAMLELPDGEE